MLPLEHLAQQVADQLQRALPGLQRDVAGEAVGDDHVGGAGGDVVAFDEAVELRADDSWRAAPRRRRARGRRPSAPRSRHSAGRCVGAVSPSTVRANMSPMTANSTRLRVSQATFAPRSSITTSPRADGPIAAIAGRSMPGSDLMTILASASSAPVLPAETTPWRLAGRHRVDGQPHAGVAHAQRRGRLHLVADDLGRVANRAGAGRPAMALQQRRQPGLVADQQKAGGRMALGGDRQPLDHRGGRVVAAHGVHRQRVDRGQGDGRPRARKPARQARTAPFSVLPAATTSRPS